MAYITCKDYDKKRLVAYLEMTEAIKKFLQYGDGVYVIASNDGIKVLVADEMTIQQQ